MLDHSFQSDGLAFNLTQYAISRISSQMVGRYLGHRRIHKSIGAVMCNGKDAIKRVTVGSGAVDEGSINVCHN